MKERMKMIRNFLGSARIRKMALEIKIRFGKVRL